MSRQDLIDRVWKEAFVTDTSLAEAVSGLRQLLDDDPQSPTYIQTRTPARVSLRRAGRGPRTPAGHSDGSGEEAQTEVVFPSIGGQLVPWSAAALCGLIALVSLYQLTHRQTPQPVAGRFAVCSRRASISTLKGWRSRCRRMAVRQRGPRVHQTDADLREAARRLDPVALSGTDDGASPFFSPDGAWLGFFAEES